MEQEPTTRLAPSLAPEHDWTAAATVVRPAFRPVGTTGSDGRELRPPSARGGPGKSIIRIGPAGLPVVYVIPGRGFDVVVGVEHLLAWGVGPEQVHAAAMANLARWSDEAAWTDEVSGGRRVISSDLGEGLDAARILLTQVRARLAADLGGPHRILVGIPERNLLVAARLGGGDDEFASLFADYVADRARAADEPIDSRVFELLDDELIALAIDTPA
ncbi:MAG TPA: hypothetical protein VF344_03335 [Candidatus Limnocylindrales bacterium]